MIELVRRLSPSRWQVHVACFRTEGAWFPRIATAAASVGTFPLTGFARAETLRQGARFIDWCRERGVTLIQTSDLYTNIFFLPAAAAAGIPVRIGARREIAAGKSRLQVLAQRASYAWAHRVVANAGAVAERLTRERVSPARITVVPNGLDLSRYVGNTPVASGHRVTMVANLRPGKGHDTLIDAAPLVLARVPDATVRLVGDGPERPRLEQRVRDRGVAHAVMFEGHVEDVADCLAHTDVFTLPSDSEAFPNAVLEAMAAGVPVVASAVGGVLEVVDHGRTGLLVPPGNPSALADALCQVLTDRASAAAMAGRARDLAHSHFSFGRMVDTLEQLYIEELARRAPERAVHSAVAPF